MEPTNEGSIHVLTCTYVYSTDKIVWYGPTGRSDEWNTSVTNLPVTHMPCSANVMPWAQSLKRLEEGP